MILDELDKELERRGLEFCRFADDSNIFVGSQKAAERVMHRISKFIENKLKLVINQDKSKVALSKYVKFLGMTIIAGTIAISAQLVKIEAHIRRRLRARLVDQQKGKRNLFKKLVKRGVPRKMAGKAAYSNRRRWALSHTLAVDRAYPSCYFIKEMGLEVRSSEKQPHWVGLNQWIRVT